MFHVIGQDSNYRFSGGDQFKFLYSEPPWNLWFYDLGVYSSLSWSQVFFLEFAWLPREALCNVAECNMSPRQHIKNVMLLSLVTIMYQLYPV